ncbi:helix-turn-helix domain-containing protein [Kribbella sandramycini]|uniref:Helix-turn-helix domain-containing protein n=1 Tax=Kribbella sandramycini TaxID=60450 RepID=A0A7Y4KXB5_9ACTN|nr:helix-turn-helix domain-containing protein [Kribbella sandramycini]MBB6569815.1 transcriptional regulator with XRE-family HTH domain/tetratricopeptide (TPR) repeat protein [Kribbella sandramycini]NOL40358.1 helix-turn-helix domain-containing protein [Kribbella sandramycini]
MDSSALAALGAAMLRYRMARGLSLRQLAARLGMQGHGGLSDYEKGRRLAPADLIERYEHQLGITDGELRALRAAALAERATNHSEPAADAAAAVTIAELPAVPADFQGRSAELAAVMGAAADCLAGQGPVTVVVTGQPGAGKTTLAVHAAQQAFRLGLRDAQFFVELGTAEPDAVLRRLLRALGVPDAHLPPEVDEAAAMFRSRMAGRRCVLVLDNARDEAQVRALLPGPGPVLVVVTSRQRLTGLAGARRVGLAELTMDDAQALLSDIVGSERAAAEPESVAEVVAACARLPLAVRIAGNRLAAWPEWSIAHLAELLRDEQNRLGRLTAGDLAVRSAFALSYREVPPIAGRLFRRLALAPGADFDVQVASALLGEPAEAALEVLAGASLIGLAATPGRYRMHDLLQLYACELLQDDAQRDKAERALFSWLFEHSRRAAAALSPESGEFPGGRTAAVAWLDAEASSLLGAVRRTRERTDGEYDELLGDLTQLIPWYYDLRCRWSDMVEVADHARVVADRLGDLAARAFAYSMLGLGQLGQHRYRAALASCQLGLADARAAALAAEEAELFGRMGLAYEGLGQYAEAEARHADHAEQCRVLGDRLGEAAAIGRRSHALQLLGRHTEAAACLKLALKMRSDLGDERGVAMAEYRFSALRNNQGQHEEAVLRSNRALAVFQAHDDQWGTAVAHYELGRALAGLGRLREAASAYRTAVRGLEQVGEWQRLAEATAALTDVTSR